MTHLLDEQAVKTEVMKTRMTLALLSNDFLLTPWFDLYDTINSWFATHSQRILPILAKPCDWRRSTQVIPRSKPIGKPDNDEAWVEVSKALRHMLKEYYPVELQHL